MDYVGARPEAKRVLLMPGSRKQEVLSLLDVMLESGERLLQSHEDVQDVYKRQARCSIA